MFLISSPTTDGFPPISILPAVTSPDWVLFHPVYFSLAFFSAFVGGGLLGDRVGVMRVGTARDTIMSELMSVHFVSSPNFVLV